MSTMLFRTKLTMLGLLAATAITGCGTDPITRHVGVFEEAADVICTCPGAILQPSEAACREELTKNVPTEAEEACMRRVYETHSAELDPVFDCQHAAGRALIDCLEPLLATCPPPLGDAGECVTTYNQANEACPTPSTQASAELNACFASRS